MSRLFIIAHAPLASAMKALAEHAFADTADVLKAFDVPDGDDIEAYLAHAARILDSLPSGDTLLLTDIFGATPCNLARQLAEERGLHVLTGLNLPMLWRLLNYRARPTEELVALALAGATQGVMQLKVTPKSHQPPRPDRHDSPDSHHQQ